ncbi:MAG: hypothetical protein JF606_18370 [Burkholderiales bacterium]|jgi:hypothetical protein|nr:hypothetical protein [Burkholderiales bacterium]
MNSHQLSSELDIIAAQPSIIGCALVDASTGLVWHARGGVPKAELIWEAAVDYWRLHDRQKLHFAGLGALGAAVMYHTLGVLAVFPCCSDPDVLLVSHGQHQGVDWIALQRKARALGDLLRSSG